MKNNTYNLPTATAYFLTYAAIAGIKVTLKLATTIDTIYTEAFDRAEKLEMLAKKTVKQLYAYAKEVDLAGRSKLNKSALCEALVSYL